MRMNTQEALIMCFHNDDALSSSSVIVQYLKLTVNQDPSNQQHNKWKSAIINLSLSQFLQLP